MAKSAEKVLQLARVTSELMNRFQSREEKTAAEKTAVASLVPAAVGALVEHERIFPNQKEDVATKIASSHAACIELITKLAAHRNASEVDQIGTQVGQEKAASDQAYPAVGAPISDHDDRPSGQAFRSILMGGGHA